MESAIFVVPGVAFILPDRLAVRDDRPVSSRATRDVSDEGRSPDWRQRLLVGLAIALGILFGFLAAIVATSAGAALTLPHSHIVIP